MASADNHKTGSCKFSTPPMVSLDTYQFCASAGILQALQGDHHLALRVQRDPKGPVTMLDLHAAAGVKMGPLISE